MLLRAVLLFCALQVFTYGQYYPYPAPPPPSIGFLPIFLPNNSYPYNNNNSGYNVTRFNNTGVNNNNNYGWGGCQPNGYDVPGSHSLFVGCVGRNDTLLFQQLVDKPSRFFSPREKIIDFPGSTLPQGHVYNRLITGLRCYDLKGRGKGGVARIVAGGVGQTHVKINLTSVERNKGLYYRVEIYGR